MRYQPFYNLASNIAYPFDDAATLIDDNGIRLPEGLFCDFSCVIDSMIARRVFCSSVTRKDDFCSVVFAADNEQKLPLGFLNFNLSQSPLQFSDGISPQRQLTSLSEGFQGRLVAGTQWEQIPNGIWRFSNPAASRISARCCFPLKLPGRQSITAGLAARPLAGTVELTGEGDVSIRVEQRNLGGVEQQAIAIGLQPNSGLLADYAGPNLGRPESRSCDGQQPIETINGIGPDCCGRIYIELRGCAQPIPISNMCGIVLDCPLTLSEICPKPTDTSPENNPDSCLAEGATDPLQPPAGAPKPAPNW